MEKFISSTGVMEIAGCDRATLSRAHKSGSLKSVARIGASLVFDKEEATEWATKWKKNRMNSLARSEAKVK